jgi:hypothetical protein
VSHHSQLSLLYIGNVLLISVDAEFYLKLNYCFRIKFVCNMLSASVSPGVLIIFIPKFAPSSCRLSFAGIQEQTVS